MQTAGGSHGKLYHELRRNRRLVPESLPSAHPAMALEGSQRPAAE